MGKRWLNRVFELAKSLAKKIKGGGALAKQLQEEVDVFARDVFRLVDKDLPVDSPQNKGVFLHEKVSLQFQPPMLHAHCDGGDKLSKPTP